MANSDYIKRGSGLICPVATTVTSLAPDTTAIDIRNYTTDGSIDSPPLYSAVMIDGEIMRLDGFTPTGITVGRGCGDTIPHEIPAGKPVWFLCSPVRVGSDQHEYAAGGTVGVKVLMRSSGASLDVQNVPPKAVNFAQRFARPYPPGQVLVDGDPWFSATARLSADKPEAVVSWVHRNRVTQADQLVSHDLGNVTPEPGTTYRVRVFTDDGTLKRTEEVTGTSWTYTWLKAQEDLGTVTAGVNGYATINTLRDGFESRDTYRIALRTAGLATGWGNIWGSSWGQ